jgi:AraC-like DNA-binding protein
MMESRAPCPALRPYVRLLWAGTPAADTPHREHVLPTGCMHLALRVGGPPLRLFDGPGDEQGRTMGHAVVGGARAGFYVREAGLPGLSVGAQLEPGAAAVLFGPGADALSESHTPLDALWGRASDWLLERLAEAGSPRQCLALLEAELLARLAPRRAMHPGVGAALAVLRQGASVDQAVRASGLSHRHLVLRFRAAAGLAPKQHARVLRLQAALEQLARAEPSTAVLAADTGYADQSHFSREFRLFAGLTPGEWRAARPAHPHHVPVPAGH